MKNKNFEEYLQDAHAEQADGVLDDDMPDDYENWLVDLSSEDWISLGEDFGKEMFNKGQLEPKTILPEDKIGDFTGVDNLDR